MPYNIRSLTPAPMTEHGALPGRGQRSPDTGSQSEETGPTHAKVRPGPKRIRRREKLTFEAK